MEGLGLSPRNVKRTKPMKHRLHIPNMHSSTKPKPRTNIIGESLSEAKLVNVEPRVNKPKQAEIERKEASS